MLLRRSREVNVTCVVIWFWLLDAVCIYNNDMRIVTIF